jgi:hypothetical protein
MTVTHRPSSRSASRQPLEQALLQKSTDMGSSPAMRTAGGGVKAQPPAAQHGPVDNAQEVNLMAQEVWTLLKHRFKAEAERRGRW